MASVETMASFAGRPVRRQTDIFQSKPNGSIAGETNWPIAAKYECSRSFRSGVGKYSNAQIITDAHKMTVQIFCR